MTYRPGVHRRRSIRLPQRDYRAGWYFVTICTQNRVCLFGEIAHGVLHPSEHGTIVAEAWREIGRQFPMAKLDAWVLMPNHLHAIVGLRPLGPDRDTARTPGAPQRAPTIAGESNRPIPRAKTLGGIIGAFKTATTRRVNALSGTPGVRFWQRNFHEWIIRDAAAMRRIRLYIRNNPLRWEQDEENPHNRPLPQR